MSTTIEFETIGSRLQSLEVALQAQNESHEQIVLSNATPKAAAAVVNAVNAVNANSPSPTRPNAVGVGNINVGTALPPALPSGVFAQPPRSMRPTPNLPISEVGTVRNRHMVLQLTKHAHPSETETDKKLKMIMGQTGKLNINGRQYPTDINDLRHLGDLGNGTSGNVVKMLHLSSNTIIAVKQMRRTGNAEENKRILMDLDVVLKSHDCKYIVKCLGCFVRDPDVWICMELMSMCFDKLLKLTKKPVPEPILGKVTVATVNALAYLKDKHGVIHRDVKPSNILIDERGNIKLCDFGISGRLVDSKANTRSAGCAAYMAPERIDPKKPKYDIRADVWSLGITLVELATARSPYEGCNTDFEVLTKVLDSEPPCLPRGEGFNFSQQFHDFVINLTKNHQDRPKYPELLAQPFIKIYELADVDVPSWFQMVMDSAAGRRMRANGDSTLTRNDIGKLYRKSPFMQRKLSNGSQYNNKYNDESPKRESVLSSIGQSILRNLTTSPFSQKKHHAMVTATTPTTTTTTLPQYKSKLATPTEHITPSWRLPATTTTAAAAAATPEHSLMPFVDTCDSNNSNVNALSLPKQLIADNALLQLNNQQQQQQQQQRLQPGNQSPIGWFNTLAGAMKRQFATYVKTQLNSTATSPTTATTTTSSSLGQELEPALAPQPPPYRSVISNGSSSAGGGKSYYYHRTLSAASSSSSHNTSQSTSPTTEPLTGPGPGLTGGGGGGGTSGFLRRYASSGGSLGLHTSGSISTPPSPHLLAGVDRRHRSPDPPPRYNRGQSPLLLRKNLLELSGQPPGSPLLQRRYVSASPPLPPPRRGSESVPGSPQHFRTRIHYTPEPQRRIYRTIDQ
ncbi:hep [Drosophila busckii]|uniref:mitogen-activated protein kinase kinase n=1 Tax=Drosophila busckii TaxID=30019 RepID=A0A0M5J819_DROBS|nr:hep [Drosophila busckii]